MISALKLIYIYKVCMNISVSSHHSVSSTPVCNIRFFSQDAGLYCQYLGAASVSSVYKILQNVLCLVKFICIQSEKQVTAGKC